MMSGIISCKKDTNDSLDNTIKVRYEITSTLAFNNDPAYASVHSIGYTNATYNVETVTNLSGKVWTKEFTISEPRKDYPVVVTGSVILQGIIGQVTTKIYVNGVVKSETNQAVQQISDELSMAAINASYTL